MTISVSYDPSVDALMLRVAEGELDDTIPATESINLDVDAEGRLLRIEILSASHVAPALVAAAGKRKPLAAE